MSAQLIVQTSDGLPPASFYEGVRGATKGQEDLSIRSHFY